MNPTAVEMCESHHRTGPKKIPVGKLKAHPLNANVLPDDYLAKLRAHIKQSGQYPYIVVRPIEGGTYQILDGHHRVRVLRELGHQEIRCDVWEVTDREAKLLLATLNRLEGQDLPIKRAQLIHEILAEMTPSDLGGLIPESENEIAELEALLRFPADEIAELLDEQTGEEEKVLPRVMTFVVTPEQEETIERAIHSASDGIQGRDFRARGLTELAHHYLDGNDAEAVAEEPA